MLTTMINLETILLVITLGLAWVPLTILLVASVHNVSAKRMWKFFGIPSLVAFLIVWLYSSLVGLPLASLIGWGVVSGIALTIALDIVRLTGVKLGTMPMDMPVSFGLRATGLFEEVKKKMMARMKEVGMSGPPQGLTMFGAATMMKPVIAEVLNERRARGRVMFWGYLWHFLNGITFGLTYALVFASGYWLVALGWGITVWILMMLVMPAMMNGAGLTTSIFLTALIAHIAMTVPLMFLPRLMPPELIQRSLLAFIAKLVGI